MKMKKRFLSILLSLIMVLGLLPGMSLTAYAVETYTITPSSLDYPEGQYDALATNASLPYDTDAKALMAAIGYESNSISYINSVSISSGTNISLGKSTGTPGTAEYNIGISITGQGEAVVEVVAYATWQETITCRIAVSVYPAGVILPTISLDKSDCTIAIGNKLPLTATIVPENATDKAVKWSVSGTDANAVKLYSDENCTTEIGSDATPVLTVYAKGISAGNATVTVTSNTYTTRTASCVLTVTDQYNLWIGGEEVTSTNSSGTGWSYDVGNNALNLTNYSYVGVGYKEGNTDEGCSAIYYIGSAPLIIKLSGTNSITRTGSSGIKYGDSSYCGIKTRNCSHLTINGSSADSLNVTCEGGKASAIYLIDGTTLTIQNISLAATTPADSGNSSISCDLVKVANGASVKAMGGYNGISANVEISENSSVIAAGNNKAIGYTVKNAITGTGWTNKEGTEGQEDIAISTEGQLLPDYKKVQFTAAEKPAAIMTKIPEAKTLTYNGSAQALVTAGEATGGEMQYALGTETEATQPYTPSIPTATDAGTYFVWYKVQGDENHNDTTPVCISVAIEKAESKVTVGPVAIKGLEVNGSAQKLVTDGTGDGGLMVYTTSEDDAGAPTGGWTADIPTATDAGIYYVWYKVKGDDNHTDTTPVCIPVTISAVETVTITFDAGGGTGSMAPVGIEKGSQYTLPNSSFIPPANQVFAHWKIGEKPYAVNDGITVAADLTVTAVWTEKTEDKESKIVLADLTSVPDELKNKFFSIKDLKDALLRALSFQGMFTSEENSVFYDVVLMVRRNGGPWVPATKEDFENGPLTVKLAYPSGTGMNTHNFKVAHMFTVEMHGHQPGQIETPPVTKGESGITVELDGLSPVAISWNKIDEKAIGSLPQTGDTAKPLLYGFLALIALVGLGLLIKKK